LTEVLTFTSSAALAGGPCFPHQIAQRNNGMTRCALVLGADGRAASAWELGMLAAMVDARVDFPGKFGITVNAWLLEDFVPEAQPIKFVDGENQW
jgi:hypothetical protein